MRWTTRGLSGAVAKSVVGGALIVLAATVAPAQAFAMPATAGTFGAPVPLEPPTGPDDDSCISQPADPVCGGGPYALPSPPVISIPSPAMDGGMPGIAGIGGMPGQI
jgi:hypothetical protein